MVGRPGPGNRGGAGAPGLAAGAALGGLGAPKGPVRGLAVVAGVPAQARRKHLRVSTRWALPAGNRRDRNFGALWQRGEGAPAWTPPGGRRGGSGDAPAHPSGGQGLGDAPSARASRGGRPRGTRRGRGDTCPKTPAPPPHLPCPAPDQAPPLQAPPRPPPQGVPPGPARPGLPLPTPAPPRPRASQAGPGLTGEASPPAGRRGSELPSSVRPSLSLTRLPLPVPVPRPPQPPPPPLLGGHCPFKSLPPPPRPPGAPP